MSRLRRLATLVPLLATTLVFCAGNLRAQSIGGMLVNDVRNSAGDAWDVWTAPFRGTASDWLGAAGVIAAGAAVSPLDASVDQWVVANRNDAVFHILQPIREGGVAFSGKTITPVALGVLAVGLATTNQTLQDGLFGYAVGKEVAIRARRRAKKRHANASAAGADTSSVAQRAVNGATAPSARDANAGDPADGGGFFVAPTTRGVGLGGRAVF